VLIEDTPQISVVVPTLNEEKHIRFLLKSIEDQFPVISEIVIVDGGSKDKTTDIVCRPAARIIVLPGHGEFISRNIGAKMAKGDLLLFTCADIIFPTDLFQKVIDKFENNPRLIALTGPGYPFDAPAFGKIEYTVYNLFRYLFAKLPGRLKRFSTSTNFLVVRRDYFEKAGGFITDDINADGLMGKKLLELGDVAFFLDTPIYLSARRMKKMGFLEFNKHYLYVLENFLFFSSETGVVKAVKHKSKSKHRKMREK
jgi:glycosyltransferase involved in cell wall biosynthesis